MHKHRGQPGISELQKYEGWRTSTKSTSGLEVWSIGVEHEGADSSYGEKSTGRSRRRLNVALMLPWYACPHEWAWGGVTVRTPVINCFDEASNLELVNEGL